MSDGEIRFTGRATLVLTMIATLASVVSVGAINQNWLLDWFSLNTVVIGALMAVAAACAAQWDARRRYAAVDDAIGVLRAERDAFNASVAHHNHAGVGVVQATKDACNVALAANGMNDVHIVWVNPYTWTAPVMQVQKKHRD